MTMNNGSRFEQKGTLFTQCCLECKMVPAPVEISVDVHQQQNEPYYMIQLYGFVKMISTLSGIFVKQNECLVNGMNSRRARE